MVRSYFDLHPDILWTRHGGYFLQAHSSSDSTDYHNNFVDIPATPGCLIDMYEGIALGMVRLSSTTDFQNFFLPNTIVDRSALLPDIKMVAERIKSALPNAKILLIIRNQVDWLRSCYTHLLRWLPPGHRSFYDFITTPYGKCVLHAGHFHETIHIYQDMFGNDNVHIILLEQIITHREHTIRQLCRFLGIKYQEFPPEKQHQNKGRSPALRWFLQRETFLSGLASATLFRRVEPILRRITPRDIFTDGDKAFITSMYAVSNRLTTKLSNIDLAHYNYPG